MTDPDTVIRKLMVQLHHTHFRAEPEGETLRIARTVGYVNLPLACAAIDDTSWEEWLEQFLARIGLPANEVCAVEPAAPTEETASVADFAPDTAPVLPHGEDIDAVVSGNGAVKRSENEAG